MLIDIDKIIVGDRIRKDFGDIEELADDIEENTLLNALVVTPSGNGDGTYLLIAGERRLRACKMLGYKAVPVNTVGVDDAEQALMMEISENECRKEFTKTERLEYARRLALIEGAKAKERMSEGGRGGNSATPSGKTRDKVAEQLGTSATQLRQEQFVADNADLLDPADFADWDEGKLSTNRAYQRIRAAKEQAERERDDAREDNVQYQRDVQELQAEIAALEKQNDELYQLANTQQVVEREVVREVKPDDYDEMKRRVRELEGSNRLYTDDNESLRRQLEDAQSGAYDHERIMDAAKLEADMFRRKYSELNELADVIAAINQFLSV